MKRKRNNQIETVLFFIITGWPFLISAQINTEAMKDSSLHNRRAAYAGSFYPADSFEINKQMESFFKNAVSPVSGNTIAVVSPHAGYVFSGQVAASAFNQVNLEKKFKNVFIIASSHRMTFSGASVYTSGNYETPMGKIEVNQELGKMLVSSNPDVFSDQIAPHLDEHSLEVQLPFLQYIFKNEISLVPIIIGTHDSAVCRKIADGLRPWFNPDNLFVISTDFSHFPSYDLAVKEDSITADAVCSNNTGLFLKTIRNEEKKYADELATCMCGWTSVLVLLYLTEGNPAFSYHKIQYKNSGDTLYGDKKRVVGYNAIAVSIENPDFTISEEEQKTLLAIARTTIKQYLQTGDYFIVEKKYIPAGLKSSAGAFVTLKKKDELRGCIGTFSSDKPLYSTVQEMAIASATRDFRFAGVTINELDSIKIEISVLSPMRKIADTNEIILGKHGVYIVKNGISGTFLPQVAIETGWSREELLGHLSRDKAGIGWEGWKTAEIYIYEAFVFGE